MAREVDKFKAGFFDRAAVKAAMGNAARKGMLSGGSYTRTVARNSMKKRPGPSDVGSAPNVHVGTLKNLLYFAYDQSSKSLVIGPVGLGGSDVPKVLEFGGRRIKPRPYMRPAMQAALTRFGNSVRMGIGNEVR